MPWLPRLLLSTALVVAVLPTQAEARPSRAALARDQFQHAHPCPSTGMAIGRCPGWVLRYIQPLCAGGTVSAGNLQWLTRHQAKAKARHDKRQCKALRR